MYLKHQLKTLLYVRELAKVLVSNPCRYSFREIREILFKIYSHSAKLPTNT